MTSDAWPMLVFVVATGLRLAILLGLIRRRHLAACWSFDFYLIGVFLGESLVACLPSFFRTREFWLLKESVYNALKFAIAVELALRTFQAFPGARATARLVVLAVLVGTGLAIALGPKPGTDWDLLSTSLQPRIATGTVWLFTAIAGLILWYRLPVDPFRKAVLLGFVPYLLVFSAGLSLLKSYGKELQYFNYLNAIVYVGLLGYWAYAAWRPAPAPKSSR